jgi:hypothetical protein
VSTEDVAHVPESAEPHTPSEQRDSGQANSQKERKELGNHTEKRRQQGQAKLDRGRGNMNRGNRGQFMRGLGEEL